MIAALLFFLAGTADWQSSLVVAPKSEHRLALRDLDGDGRRELLVVGPGGGRIHPMGEGGVYPAEAAHQWTWGSERLGWDVADLNGDGQHELLVLEEGRRLLRHALDGTGGLDEGQVLLDDLRCFLPRGRWYTSFVRDVNGDGRADLALPGAGQFLLYLQAADGQFAEAIAVNTATQVDFDLGDPEELNGRFGQAVRIPFFRMEDVDGDGTRDLVADDGDRVAFHLASPALSATPTWSLDVAERRRALKRRRPVDLGDLFSNLDPQVKWKLAELDGQAPRDLVLQEGSTFKIYLGGAAVGPKASPDHALRASGNVLHFLLRDVLGDPLPELQVIRAERISLGTAVRWLVLPGSLEFDVFTYLNGDGKISRKPEKRTTLSLEIPRLLSLEDEVEEISDELEEKVRIAATVACLDGDGQFNDVVNATEEGLAIYRNALAEEWVENSLESLAHRGVDMDVILEAVVLDEMDNLKDGGTKTLGLEDLRDLKLTTGGELLAAMAGKQPTETLALKAPFDPNQRRRLLALDLDSNGTSDFVLVGENFDGELVIQLVVAGD